MSNSYTQDNTAYGTSTGNTGPRDNDPSLSSQNPSSGHDTTNTGSGYERCDSGNTSSTGLGNMGTNTTEHHGIGSGRGQGTGVGHHKAHHEGHLHEHGSDEAAKANYESCTRNQAAGGIGAGGNEISTTSLDLRPGEIVIETIRLGVARDDDPLARTGATTMGSGTGYVGDTSGNRGGDDDPLARTGATTMGSGTGAGAGDTTGNRGGATKMGSGTGDTAGKRGGIDTTGFGTGGDNYGKTGMGAKPTMMDKIVGSAEKARGKLTSNSEIYQRGEERTAGEFETARKN